MFDPIQVELDLSGIGAKKNSSIYLTFIVALYGFFNVFLQSFLTQVCVWSQTNCIGNQWKRTILQFNIYFYLFMISIMFFTILTQVCVWYQTSCIRFIGNQWKRTVPYNLTFIIYYLCSIISHITHQNAVLARWNQYIWGIIWEHIRNHTHINTCGSSYH